MKTLTLKDFKNEVAKEKGYTDYYTFVACSVDEFVNRSEHDDWDFHADMLDEASEKYATYKAEEACRLQRELCAENAVTKWDSNKEEPFDIIVDKDSIINSPCPKL